MFKQKCCAFFQEFGNHKNMVLSTSYNDVVTSRMMSIVQLDGNFYFQADMNSRKAKQLAENKNVSLCIDNVQIDGVCRMLGMVQNNECFCSVFEKYYGSAYRLYTNLPNERLFAVVPVRIQKWVYENNMPYIEIFDFETHKYNKTAYLNHDFFKETGHE